MNTGSNSKSNVEDNVMKGRKRKVTKGRKGSAKKSNADTEVKPVLTKKEVLLIVKKKRLAYFITR